MKKGIVIGIIIGAFLFGKIGVYAAITYSATEIKYKNTTVEAAINDLYANSGSSEPILIATSSTRFAKHKNQLYNENYFEFSESSGTYKVLGDLNIMCYISTIAAEYNNGARNSYVDIYVNSSLDETIVGTVLNGTNSMNVSVYEKELKKDDELYFYARTTSNSSGQYNVSTVICNLK